MSTRKWMMMVWASMCAGAAIAAPAGPELKGVWEGSVGNSAIRACFHDGGGEYYYLRHLRGIPLEADEKASGKGRWAEVSSRRSVSEGAVSGYWQIDPVGADGKELTGKWSDASGKKLLPIKLRMIAGPDGEHNGFGCANEYYRPIVSALRYKYKPARFGSIRYRQILSATGSAFEVPDDHPGAERLNRFIKRWLEDQAIAAYGCEIGGGGEAWSPELKPVVWSGSLLVLLDTLPDTYCGGAHGNWSINHMTFDARTAEPINTWSWLKQGQEGVERNGDDKRTKLRALLEGLNPRDDCGEYNDMMSLQAPYPTKKGLVFPTYYPHVVRACTDEIVVPYKKIMPYLSDAGKQAIAEFQASK